MQRVPRPPALSTFQQAMQSWKKTSHSPRSRTPLVWSDLMWPWFFLIRLQIVRVPIPSQTRKRETSLVIMPHAALELDARLEQGDERTPVLRGRGSLGGATDRSLVSGDHVLKYVYSFEGAETYLRTRCMVLTFLPRKSIRALNIPRIVFRDVYRWCCPLRNLLLLLSSIGRRHGMALHKA